MVQIQKNMNLHSFNAAVTIQQMFPGISAVASVWTYDHLNYFIFIWHNPKERLMNDM